LFAKIHFFYIKSKIGGGKMRLFGMKRIAREKKGRGARG